MSTYAQIILPLRLAWTPWYLCGETPSVGDRVSVNFARKEYLGVVCNVSDNPGIDTAKIKPIVKMQPDYPSISARELALWKFIAEYYLCSIGEVYKAACPILKIRSEGIAAGAAERCRLSQERLEAAMQARVVRLQDRLACKKAAFGRKRDGTKAKEELRQGMARLEKELEAAEGSLSELRKAGQPCRKDNGQTDRKDSNQPCREDTGQGNCGGPGGDNQGVTGRKRDGDGSVTGNGGGRPLLLCGRERLDSYIKRIGACLEGGRDALVMVPESAVGERMAERLSGHFSGRIIEFNSKMTPARRRRAADRTRDSHREPQVVIGTRVSLFLPFSNLGLVIVDEEQDNSYKQTEPAPRYNARDCAVVLAKLHGAGAVLGSAFPSLESLNNSIEGKYSIERLREPYPAVEIIDLAAEKRKRGVTGLFSYKMIDAIRRFPGPVAVIRGWEKEEDVAEQSAALFPGKEIEIMNSASARKGIGADRLCAVLQADAFFEKDRFRSDEHCLQQLSQFGQSAAAMIVQTARSSHPVYAALAGRDRDATARMLGERRVFRLPPYTRLLDVMAQSPDKADTMQESLTGLAPLQQDKVIIQRTGPCTVRVVIPRDASLKSRKEAISGLVLPAGAAIDVDPL